MFDSEFSAASDEELIAAVEDGARREAAEAARQLAAIAELTRRRIDNDDERALWAFDPWDSAAAEVAAALRITHRRASGRMRIAMALRDRLPKVAALHVKGELTARVVSTITWLTQLVEDDQALALIDEAVAERASGWEALSEDKLRQAVEVWVHRYDPDAVRRTQVSVRSRDLTIGTCDDDAETTALWGRLLATDAAVLQKRVTAMARAVCDGDPRSIGERRADALGALAHGHDRLVCACGAQGCPSAGEPPTSNVVIRVIADQTALDAATAAAAETTASPPAADTQAPQPPTNGEAPPPAQRVASPALILGRGVLPNALLAEAIRAGARITVIRMPGAEPEPHYRPSAELAEFVRMRDLFCRFPGCPVPADRCDLDHARPWPWGPTHASNVNCKCRPHHLMKTFWTGLGGWADEQLPDGTVVWTSPSGTTYTTQPGSRLFFPTWNVTTAALPPPATDPPPPTGDRTLMMPRRQRTRAADHTARIKTERAQRDLPPPF